jgi:four helix bundle protein
MENPGNINFNQQLRDRTLNFSVAVHDLFRAKKILALNHSTVNQILRSSSSVAANFRSATRSRSDAEFYSKICIVTEEIDETQFWLEYSLKTGILTMSESSAVKSEADQLVRLFTVIKKKLKDKLQK